MHRIYAGGCRSINVPAARADRAGIRCRACGHSQKTHECATESVHFSVRHEHLPAERARQTSGICSRGVESSAVGVDIVNVRAEEMQSAGRAVGNL